MVSHGNCIETIPTGIRTIKHQYPSLCMRINQQMKPGLRSPMSENRAKPVKDVMKYLSVNQEDRSSCRHDQAVEIQSDFVYRFKGIH